MALGRPPLSDSYELVSPFDSAIDRDAEDFENRLRIATERLEWSTILREGQQPTKFICRAVDPLPLRYWNDHEGFHEVVEIPEGQDNAGAKVSIPTQIGLSFLVLMSVQEVKNWPGLPEIKRKRVADFRNLGLMADEVIVAALDAEDIEAGRPRGSTIQALGQLCWQRNMLRPKR